MLPLATIAFIRGSSKKNKENSDGSSAKIVAKSEVTGNKADTNDMCVLIPGDATTDKYGYYLRLNEAFSLASGAGTDKLVIEMDIACVDAAYNINFTDQDVKLGSVLKSTAKSGTYTLQGTTVYKGTRDMAEREFVLLKIVIDQSTQKWSAYWNGDPVLTDAARNTNKATNFGSICITETDSTGNAKLYIDNIKIYKMETTE